MKKSLSICSLLIMVSLISCVPTHTDEFAETPNVIENSNIININYESYCDNVFDLHILEEPKFYFDEDCKTLIPIKETKRIGSQITYEVESIENIDNVFVRLPIIEQIKKIKPKQFSVRDQKVHDNEDFSVKNISIYENHSENKAAKIDSEENEPQYGVRIELMSHSGIYPEHLVLSADNYYYDGKCSILFNDGVPNPVQWICQIPIANSEEDAYEILEDALFSYSGLWWCEYAKDVICTCNFDATIHVLQSEGESSDGKSEKNM